MRFCYNARDMHRHVSFQNGECMARQNKTESLIIEAPPLACIYSALRGRIAA